MQMRGNLSDLAASCLENPTTADRRGGGDAIDADLHVGQHLRDLLEQKVMDLNELWVIVWVTSLPVVFSATLRETKLFTDSSRKASQRQQTVCGTGRYKTTSHHFCNVR